MFWGRGGLKTGTEGAVGFMVEEGGRLTLRGAVGFMVEEGRRLTGGSMF